MLDICIYSNKNNNKILLSQVINFLKPNSIVFSEENYKETLNPDITKYAGIGFYNTSLLFDGEVVFLGVEDFKLRHNSYSKQKKMLFVAKEDIVKLDKGSLENTTVYIHKNDQIRKAKNAELQSILR